MADICRVAIDLDRIQTNVLSCEGTKLTQRQIRDWLAGVGFKQAPDGKAWLGDESCLKRLDKSEFKRLRTPGRDR